MHSVVVHIGLPKTGTTLLQDVFFKNILNTRCFLQTEIWNDEEARKVLKYLLCEDRDREECRAILDDYFLQNRNVLISDECLSLGRYLLRATKWDITDDQNLIWERLLDLFPNIHIVCVVREQVSWLVSWHKQGVKNGRFGELIFDEWFKKELPQKNCDLLVYIDYFRLYKQLCEKFGSDKVSFLYYEDYINDFSRLAEFVASKFPGSEYVHRDDQFEVYKNVSSHRAEITLPIIHKLLRVPVVRKFADWMPVNARMWIRKIFSYEATITGPSKDLQIEIRSIFEASNKSLFDEIGGPVGLWKMN